MRLAKPILCAAVLLGVALSSPVIAQGKSGKKEGFCPPGLAKKDPPCVPPGLAKKGYRVGDRIDEDYDPELKVIYEWDGHRLPDPPEGMGYYRLGEQVLLLDHDTGEIISLFNAITDVLN